MSTNVMHLTGQQAEYDLRMLQTDSGPIPVLVGISARLLGETHYLGSVERIEFADQSIELAKTALADSHNLSGKPHNISTIQNQQSGTTASDLPAETSGDESEPVGINKFHASNPQPSNYSQTPANTLEDEIKTNENSSFAHAINSLDNPAPVPTLPLSLTAGEATLAVNMRISSDAGASGLSAPNINNQFTEFLKDINLIEGTSAADLLIGTAANDRIDGMRNTNITNSFFHEQLWGGNGDDSIFYRGFFGTLDASQRIEATLLGQSGNDSLNVVLDRATHITVDGGDGINHLTVEAPETPFSPWQPGLIEWSWAGSPSAPTLLGTYTSPLNSQASIVETSGSFTTISAGNASPLSIARPDSLDATNLTGSSQADFLLATSQTKEIFADAGNDTIIARSGNIVHTGAGINAIYAYASDVTISYEDSAYAVNLNLANHMGLIFDDASNIFAVDRFMSPIQNVTGSTRDDTIKGDELDNVLRTHGGNDNLEGGSGADTFIIDAEGNSIVDIHDFNIDETDQLLINLSQWTPPLGDSKFNQYQVIDDDQQVLWNAPLNQEEVAVLTVLISQDNQNIQIGQDGHMQTVVTFDQPIDLWTLQDWASALHIDYL